MAKVTWDQSEYDEAAPRSFDPLPKGIYPCIIDNSDEKRTKAGTGSYYEFEFTVVKGDYKNRKLWARLNVNNPSDTAQRIGREQFKALCAAAGKPDANDTVKLHGKYVGVYVSIEQGQNGPQNRVDGFIAPSQFKADEDDDAPPAKQPAKPAAQQGAKAAKGSPKKSGDEPDDDIPF